MPTLNIAGPDKSGTKSVPLVEGQQVTLGRLPENTLVLPGNKVSRLHAQLVAEQGAWMLSDCNSRGGTFVNGKPVVGAVALRDGDAIAIGEFVLNYSVGESGAGIPPAASPPKANKAGGGPVAKDQSWAHLEVLYSSEVMALKKRIHEMILTKLKLTEMVLKNKLDEELCAKVEVALDAVMSEVRHELPSDVPAPAMRQALLDELIGYGPISPLLADTAVNEIMVNAVGRVFVERRGGKMTETGVRFFDENHVMTIIRRIVEPLGRRVDESSPMVDARLPDGSRVNAIIPPLALDGPSITIRKFAKEKLTDADLIRFGSLTLEMATFLREAVRSRQNILISGGTGSGKTTLLNIVSQCIPDDERIVTVEDSAELKLSHRNLVRLESRPANIEGRGKVAIRDLVVNCLRMRPDRIIVGECRGAEAFDMLQAMNTGHDGSLTTVHANNPRDSLSRLENMVYMAGFDLPSAAIREQIASAINLVVQQTRLVDGARKITQISEVTGREGSVILMQDIFVFEQTGFTAEQKVQGRFKATGNIPRFIEMLRLKGDLRLDMGVFKVTGA